MSFDNQKLAQQCRIWDAIIKERERQDRKFPDQWHTISTLSYSLTILGEEFGELCKAIFGGNFSDIRTEAIEVAAAAIAIIELVDHLKAELEAANR